MHIGKQNDTGVTVERSVPVIDVLVWLFLEEKIRRRTQSFGTLVFWLTQHTKHDLVRGVFYGVWDGCVRAHTAGHKANISAVSSLFAKSKTKRRESQHECPKKNV